MSYQELLSDPMLGLEDDIGIQDAMDSLLIVRGMQYLNSVYNGIYRKTAIDEAGREIFTKISWNSSAKNSLMWHEKHGCYAFCSKPGGTAGVYLPGSQRPEQILGTRAWRSPLSLVTGDEGEVSVENFTSEHLEEARRLQNEAIASDPFDKSSTMNINAVTYYSGRLSKEKFPVNSVPWAMKFVIFLCITMCGIITCTTAMFLYNRSGGGLGDVLRTILPDRFHDDDKTYFTSVDIGVVEIYFLSILVFAWLAFTISSASALPQRIFAQCLKDGRILPLAEVKESLGSETETGLAYLDEVLTIGFDQYIFLLCKCSLMILNIWNIWFQFSTLPLLNPAERFNVPRHIVAWLEILVVVSTCFEAFLLRCAFLVAALRNASRSKQDKSLGLPPFFCGAGVPESPGRIKFYYLMNAASGLRIISNRLLFLSTFSVLRGITSLSIPNLKRRTSFSYDLVARLLRGFPHSSWLPTFLGGVVGLNVAFLSFGTGILALLSLSCKINNLDFVMENPYSEWKLSQFLVLAAFANNIAGIVDAGSVEIAATFAALCQNPNHPSDAEFRAGLIKSYLGAFMLDRYSFCKAWVITATMTAERWQRILLHRTHEEFRWSVEAFD